MSKRKSKSGKNIKQSTAALRVQGFKHFQKGGYDQAIATWERIPPGLRPAKALAEAHFRHGLAWLDGTRPDSPAGLAALRRALEYQPGDACYTYHLGLAAHRAGELAQAIQAYQEVRKAGGPFSRRAAYPLALAQLQQDQDPASGPAWADLPPGERAILQSASLFRRRPYRLPAETPRLWQALAALDADDRTAAEAGLQEALVQAQTPLEQSFAHFYQGVLAARSEQWDEARRAWNAASAAGLRTPRLQDNLAELYHRLAEQFLTQGDIQTALEAAKEAARHRPDDNALKALLAQIHQQLGYQAASASRWEEAQQYWRSAVELDSGNFRLAYNLALAYERQRAYIPAAQTWREALRRRPRRADHPDALTDDQVARLWQRTAECYHKGGDPDEANQVYQQAVKWAPDNTDLRLALAEGLLNDGRLVAARNELARILERDPNHVPALLRLGEAYFRNDEEQWWIRSQALRYWKKALALQPGNPEVCQAMAEWYLDQAEIDYSWSRYAEAIEDYQKALEFRPGDPKILAYLAECYLELKNESKGQEYASQALEHAVGFDAYATIIGSWLRVGRPDQAWEVLAQAEAHLGKVPPSFYIDMAREMLKNNLKEQALGWLQRAVEKAAPEDNVLVMIGETIMSIDPPLAREYLQKALSAGQMPGQAHLLLGILEQGAGNSRASKKHLTEAERIARQTKDGELAERVAWARLLSGGPLELLSSLMNRGGPAALGEFLEDFLNEEFEDE